jgi:hypothetical protein
MGSTARYLYTPVSTVRLPQLGFSRNFVRQLFVKNSHTDYHENPTNDEVAYSSTQTDIR